MFGLDYLIVFRFVSKTLTSETRTKRAHTSHDQKHGANVTHARPERGCLSEGAACEGEDDQGADTDWERAYTPPGRFGAKKELRSRSYYEVRVAHPLLEARVCGLRCAVCGV